MNERIMCAAWLSASVRAADFIIRRRDTRPTDYSSNVAVGRCSLYAHQCGMSERYWMCWCWSGRWMAVDVALVVRYSSSVSCRFGWNVIQPLGVLIPFPWVFDCDNEQFMASFFSFNLLNLVRSRRGIGFCNFSHRMEMGSIGRSPKGGPWCLICWGFFGLSTVIRRSR